MPPLGGVVGRRGVIGRRGLVVGAAVAVGGERRGEVLLLATRCTRTIKGLDTINKRVVTVKRRGNA